MSVYPAWSAFIGRASELETLRRALDEHQLVTLAGPGGVGKTRLLNEVLRSADRNFVVVWLDQLRDGGGIAGSLLEALGLEPSGQPGLQRAVAALVGSETTVVFDNAEHVIEDLLPIVETLGVPVLVTSRVTLGLPDEHVIRLGELSEGEALDLLRLRAARFGSDVDDSDGIELVNAVDRLPLAIELAASRTSVLSVPQITERVKRSNRVLGSGEGRHDSLDRAMEWSWSLLTASQRDVIGTIAVADHPVAPSLVEELWPSHDVVAIAASLEAASWLRTVDSPFGKRWSTLWTLRRFVRSAMGDDVRARHADGLREWALSHTTELPGFWAGFVPEGRAVVEGLIADGEHTLASKLLVNLFFGAFGTSHFGSMLELGRALLDQTSPDGHDAQWAALATKLSKGAIRYKGRVRGIDWSAKAVRAAPPGTDVWMAAASQHLICLVDEGQWSVAEPLFETVLSISTAMPLEISTAAALLDLASAAHEFGRFDDLRETCSTVLAIGSAIGNADVEARAWIHLAYASYDLGEFDRAASEIAERDELMGRRNAHDRSTSMGSVDALIDLQMGRSEEAFQRLNEGLALSIESRQGSQEFFSLIALAEWAARHDTARTRGYLVDALQAARVAASPKSASHASLLLAVDEVAEGEFALAAERLAQLAKERPPAKPEEWSALLDALSWLARRLEGSTGVEAPPGSPAGDLFAAVLAYIEKSDESLHEMLAGAPKGRWAVPGIYFLRVDDVARRLAERLCKRPVLHITSDGQRFRVGSGSVHDMARRGPARRILLELAKLHRTESAVLSVQRVSSVGWPDEIITHDAALNRVYTTLNRLRKLGLEDVLRTVEDGYALADNVEVQWTDDP